VQIRSAGLRGNGAQSTLVFKLALLILTLGSKLVVLILFQISKLEGVQSTQASKRVAQIHMLALRLAVLIHLVILGKLNLQRRLRINTISIQPVSLVGQKYSSTWTHTCKMLWMFRSVRPVKTLAGAKQQEMQEQ
jgi:hypothetical protein